MSIKTQRYRTPRITAEVDVDLSEFGIEEIVEYVRNKGYHVTGGPVHDQDSFDEEIHPSDLDHVFTLAVASQIDAARQEALQLVGKAIGRTLQ